MPSSTTPSIEIEIPLLVDVRRSNGTASRSQILVPISIPVVEMPVVGCFLKGADLKVEYRGRGGTAFKALGDPLSPWGRPHPDVVAGQLGTIVQNRFMPPLGVEHALTGETVRSYGVPIGRWGHLDGCDLTAAVPRVEFAREAALRNLTCSGGEIHVAAPFPIWSANPEANAVSLEDPSIRSSGFVHNGQFGIGRLGAATAYVEAVAGRGPPQIYGAVQSIDPDYDRVDDLVSLAAALGPRIVEEVGSELVDLPSDLVGAFHDVDATTRAGGPGARDQAIELLTAIVRLRDWIDSPDGGLAPGHGRLEREWRKCRIRLLQIEGIAPLVDPPAAGPNSLR